MPPPQIKPHTKVVIYIGSVKNNRPKFTKIVWTKDNVKTLGIHHGYNIYKMMRYGNQ
jgi:hypothetical protein